MRAFSRKSSANSALFLAAALLAAPASARPKPSPRVLAPAPDSFVDVDICTVKVSVPAKSGWFAISLVRGGAAAEPFCRSFVNRKKESVFSCDVPLVLGENLFVVTGTDAKGALLRGPSVRVFRAAHGAGAEGPAPAPPAAPLPQLQPPPPAAPAARPAPSAAVREYGAGNCGHPPHQTMSVPVVENGRTRYVSFRTDGNGCLPPQVELK